MTLGASVLVPLPALLIIPPRYAAEASCIYLGMACAWVAGEVFRSNGGPASRAEWRADLLVELIASALNLALFLTLAISTGVQTNMPLPIMATLAVTPAIGIVPWLAVRLRRKYTELVLSAMIVLAAKLAGCVVARIVYGPQFKELGYIDGDWRNARLMITVCWALVVTLSLGGMVAGYFSLPRERERSAAIITT